MAHPHTPDAPRSSSLLRSSAPLRRDLKHWPDTQGPRPSRIVLDEITGRFWRVSERIWKQITEPNETTPEAQNQAIAAGWTRQRIPAAKRKFSILAIKVPLFRIDPFAKFAAPRSDWLFGRAAMGFWITAMALAIVMLAGNFNRLMGSLADLPLFFSQTNALLLGGILIVTKLLHELGHATMCRRIGAPCGKIGILFLFGTPCPYCDVTQIWRVTSPKRRAMVMMAGIYVELILATLATFVWWSTDDRWWQFQSLNVMLVCGISSVVFNANPLMRYDGYYVLSDFLSSVHLRRESSLAFSQALRSIIGSSQETTEGQPSIKRQSSRMGRREIGLSIYHIASSLYRVVILLVIGAIVISVAQWLQIYRVAFVLVGLLILFWARPMAAGAQQLLRGRGRWEGISVINRGMIFGVLVAAFAGILLVPVPRQCRVNGVMDAAKSTQVFISVDGVVGEVTSSFGDRVRRGQALVQIHNDPTEIKAIELQGQINVASLRSQMARRDALKSTSAPNQWESMQAVENALKSSYASVTKELEQTVVRAPIAGTVIPVSPIGNRKNRMNHPAPVLELLSGTRSDRGRAWCRICDDEQLYAVLKVDAVHRRHLQIGSPLRITEVQRPGHLYQAKVVSISAIQEEQQVVTQDASFEVLCSLPQIPSPKMQSPGTFAPDSAISTVQYSATQDILSPSNPNALNAEAGQTDHSERMLRDHFISRIGGPCQAVIDLPARSLFDDLKSWASRALQ